MGNSPTKTMSESETPLILKIGVPLVLSVTGVACVTFMSRRYTMDSNGEMNDSLEVKHVITNSQILKPKETLEFDDDYKADGEEELRNVKAIDQYYMESQLNQCCQVIKESEFMLMEIKTMLCSEANRVENLNREVSFMKDWKQLYENFVNLHLEVVDQLEASKVKNRSMQRKVKKALRKNKELFDVIRVKNSRVKEKEIEVLRCSEDVKARDHVIRKLENEAAELKAIANSLQQERNELLMKLQSTQKSDSSNSKIEAEAIVLENYNELVNEVEQLYMEREEETKELVSLRWTNACLRHELTRSYFHQQKETEKSKNLSESRLESESNLAEAGKGVSKSKKLFKKLKNWTEGSSVNAKSNFGKRETNESIAFQKFLLN